MPKKCNAFDGDIKICGGGVVVLDGLTGAVIWKHWTRKDVLFTDCSENVNLDKTKDCLISGKGGVLCVVDGKTGILIWEFTKSITQNVLDLYSAQYISDQSKDGYSDILISHTSDQSSFIILLNGKNGVVLGRIGMPDRGSIFTVPRILQTNNRTYVIFATGSIETAGSLFITPLESIAQSEPSKSMPIWKGSSAVSSGILLADMNGDDAEDIIFTSGNTLNVLDGRDLTAIWNLTLGESGNSQILMGPTPAYFNSDEIPDLLVTNMVGPSFPNYYYSESRIASGSSGRFLLDEPLLGSGEVTSPAIAISFSGFGNDMYLYWSTTCDATKLNQKQEFTFGKGTTLLEKTHADLCKLRFNSSLEVQLYALSQHIEPPGAILYSSRADWGFGHNTSYKFGMDSKAFMKKFDIENAQVPSFPHKGRHSYHRFSAQPGERKNSYSYGGKYTDDGNAERTQWDIPYDDNVPILPSVNLGDLAMRLDSSFQEDGNRNDGRDERMSYGKEMKRHAPYNVKPLPRARSTATLVDAINETGIDIVFSLFWESPMRNVRILTEKEQDCIREKLLFEQRQNKMNSLELEVAEERAERACVISRRGPLEVDEEEEDIGAREGGHLIVRRARLSCSCGRLQWSDHCSKPLPLPSQGYPARASHTYFLGRHYLHHQQQFLSR